MCANDRSGSARSGSCRRRFLAALGAAAATGVAGCSFDLDDGGDDADRADGDGGNDGGPSEGTGPVGNGDTSDTETAVPVDAGEKREPADWPGFRYDRWNTGHKTSDEGPGGEMTVRWERTVGYQPRTPIVADGTVYVTETEDGAIRALDAGTGEQRWAHQTGGPISSQPSCVALDDDSVYVGAERGVIALDRGTGDRRWTFETSDFATTPVVADGTIYVSASDFLFAIDTEGNRQWFARTGARRNLNPPTVVGDRVYLLAGGSLFALDRSTGDERWHRPVFDPLSPETAGVYRDGLLYFYGSLKVRAHDPSRNGKQVWSTARLDQAVHATPSVAHGMVYAPVAQVALRAFDATNGEGKWQRDIEVHGRPTVVGDTLYCYDRGAKSLKALDAHDGSYIRSHSLGFQSNATPTVAGGVVYVTGFDAGNDRGFVVALEEA